MKGHIKLLHEFNEVRDVGLGLIGFFPSFSMPL